MATRLTNDSTENVSVLTCLKQVSATDCSAGHSVQVQRSVSAGLANHPARKSSRKKHLLLAAAFGLLFAPSGGCQIATGIGNRVKHQEALDDFLIGYRNQAWAAKAWLCRKHRFANHCQIADLEAGFKAGYEQVAKGGDGCTPGICPKSYWGWQYQTADGQNRMNAWFEGFPLGVQAAEEDGIGHWSQVRTALPMQAPASPTMTGSAAPTLAPAVGASAALSDQTDSVPSPKADSIATPQSKTTRAASPKEAAKPIVPPAPTKVEDVKPLTTPPAQKSTLPTPKTAPVVPQPSDDPFGFD